MDDIGGSTMAGKAREAPLGPSLIDAASHAERADSRLACDKRHAAGPAGAWHVTNGGRVVEASILLVLLGAAICTVNTFSILHEAAREGRAVSAWKPWATEFTSLIGFVLALPVVVSLHRRLLTGSGLTLRIALLASGSAAFSAIHLATMIGLRELLWWILGQNYAFDLPRDWLYEYRKDLVGYAIALLVLTLAPRLRPLRSREARRSGVAPRISLRDGRGSVEIDPARLLAARAGGNYVELIFADQRRLIRSTLDSAEARLAACGFRRTHKSWLVRLGSIRRVARTESGDFRLAMEGGLEAPLSRRHRKELAEIRERLRSSLEPDH